MKILTSTPQKLEQALDQLEELAIIILPQIGRTVVDDNGFWLIGQNAAGEDTKGRTSLRYDSVHYDEGQNVHYIANVMYAPGYIDEHLLTIQGIIDNLSLVADDDFKPTVIKE